MLVLIERELLSGGELAALRSSAETRVLVAPRRGATGAPWTSADQQERRPLDEWLSDTAIVSPQPAENRIVALWRGADAGLTGAVSRLEELARNRKVALGVVLIGPLDPGGNADGLAGLARATVLRTVYFIGNEDTGQAPIGPGRREEALECLLHLLVAGGDDAGDTLGFFAAPGTGGPFAAFGLASWAPRMAGFRELLRRLAFEILRHQLTARGGGAAKEEQVLRELPAALLERLRVLDIPVSAPADGSPPMRFPDRLPELPELPFRIWACPIVRARSVEEGSEIIRRYRHDLLDYYPRLQAELIRLGSEIRRNGQAISVQVGKEVRGKVAAVGTLAGLATMLRTYFAEFEKLAGSRRSQSPDACPPATDPSHAACLKRFIDEGREHLEQQSRTLPTLKTLLVVSGVSLLLVVLSGFLLARAMPPTPGVVPGALGALLGGGTFLWAWLKARAVAREMERYYDECSIWLREHFTAKLEWVLGQTQRTLETQVIADACALGRRLAERFDVCFHDWEHVLQAPSAANAEAELLALGCSKTVLEDCRDRIANLARDIVTAATDPSVAPATDRQLASLLDDLAARAMDAAVNEPVAFDRVRDEILLCVNERQRPPILARLGANQLQSGSLKTFALPNSYAGHIEKTLTAGGSGVPARILRGHFAGPAVWLAWRPLDKQGVDKALTTSALAGGGAR